MKSISACIILMYYKNHELSEDGVDKRRKASEL
jgi:hypothetical protein